MQIEGLQGFQSGRKSANLWYLAMARVCRCHLMLLAASLYMDEKTTEVYTSPFINKLVRLWLVHLSIILLTAAALYWFDRVACYSVILGGLVFLIPNVYFAIRACCHNVKSASSEIIVHNFYRGEVGKFILSSTGFAMIFALATPTNGLVLFSTYIGLTLVQWVIALKLAF